MRWELEGGDALMLRLAGLLRPDLIAELNREAAEIFATEARRRAPRDTGLLEDSVEVLDAADGNVNVGVPPGSPALARARATEFGTRHIAVGSSEAPRTSWPSQSKSGATMPWLRAAAIASKARVFDFYKRALGQLFARF